MLIGQCHCKATGWQFDDIPKRATACNCSICRRYGVLWIYGVEGKTASLQGDTKAYSRADSGDLEFHFCPTCGNTLAWRQAAPGENGTRALAVNIRLATDPAQVMDLPLRHFDGRDTWAEVPGSAETVRDIWF